MAGPLPVLVLVFANHAGGPALESTSAASIQAATNAAPTISAASPNTLNVSLANGVTKPQVDTIANDLKTKMGCAAAAIDGGKPGKVRMPDGRMVYDIAPYKITYSGCTR